MKSHDDLMAMSSEEAVYNLMLEEGLFELNTLLNTKERK